MKNLTTEFFFLRASALLRCLCTIDLCLVTSLLGQSVGFADKGPKTLVTQLVVFAYNIPEKQRPELHWSGGVTFHSYSSCKCRLVLFISSVCKGGI